MIWLFRRWLFGTAAAVASGIGVALVVGQAAGPPSAPGLIPVGVSRVDISPTNAVRLMGYAARAQQPAPTNILQAIHARALALGADREAAVLITIDNCILPGAITGEIRQRLSRRLQLAPERIALTVTHTHSAPCLTGAAPNIFALEISAADQAQIDAYTRFFTDRLEEAALAALAQRQPARVAWGQGSAAFAKNRRTAGGPVDHALPLLRVTAPDGRLRAVLVSYACHCTTLSGELNATHGDWAGVAALTLEREHPDAIALVAIGCGADSNPDPRGTIELVNRHGEAIAAEASRLVSLTLTELTNAPACRLKTIELPFQPHFPRAEWERRATNSGIVGHHARRWLARLDRGETLPPTLPYPVQTWTFGDQLALVFLGGEVVVDYSLRLKRELDPARLWINAYANDVPCYIPSRRILKEGGYEAESSLWYYDRPQQLDPSIEDQIINTVRELVPKSFRLDPKAAELPPPKTPAEARGAFRPAAGFQIELAASEPLIDAPVAIDFGADGRLWVCEMRDYPSGLDAQGQPGGRVKVLTDSDGDGRFDQAEIIADGLPFPTGLMAWGDGVLVCAAPDVWRFEPGPGPDVSPGTTALRPAPNWRATRLLTGFATHNFQARVNGLRWGLDGWVYGSGSLFGGTITVSKTGRTFDCRQRDFRFQPDTGEFEPLAGVSQQGRIRDDFEQWFGNDNSTLLWHFPLPDRYSRRNPHAAPPGTRLVLPGEGDVGRVFPASRTLARFNDPQSANRLTSACGPEIYRDELFGPAFTGNAFVCEPVHNLVRRAELEPDGISFRTRRAPAETTAEFLASTDNWFRPVEVRTGPDGALWVVDMHRFVVEHPRWIPPERLKELDVRAGAGTGRIWRVVPTGTIPGRIRDLTKLDSVSLVAVLDSPNGIERDLAQRLLLRRGDVRKPGITNELLRLAAQSPRPASRVQMLSLLAGLKSLPDALLQASLRDPDARVRRHAVVLMEPAATSSRVPEELLALVDDPAASVRYQLALSLGEYSDPAAGRALAELALRDGVNPWMRAAILSSILSAPEAFAQRLTQIPSGQQTAELAVLRAAALKAFAAAGKTAALAVWLPVAFPPDVELTPSAQAEALDILAALTAAPAVLVAIQNTPGPAAPALDRLQRQLAANTSTLVLDPKLPGPVRVAAVGLLGESARADAVRRVELLALLDRDLPAPVQSTVFDTLRRQDGADFARKVLAGWSARPPGQRARLLGILLTREAWTDAVLEAIERNIVEAAELSPDQRQRLREAGEPGRRDRATRLLPGASSDRPTVVAQYGEVGRLTGVPARGAALFDQFCATCHALRGHGHDVGPDLAPFRGKPLDDFLTAILDPNAAVEPRFIGWTAELKDGRSLTGVVRDETSSSLTLYEPGGRRDVLPRAEVVRLSPLPHSLMPEGLEAGLNPARLADLIAWLKHTPAGFGQSTPEQMAAARESFGTDAPALLPRLEANPEVLPYPGWLGVLPLHVCRATDGRSHVQWRVVDGSGVHRLPAAMGFQSQPAGQFTLYVNGRPALEFTVSLDDATWASPDGAVELRYRVEESNAEDSNGVLEVAVAPSWAPAGEPVTFEVRGSASNSQRWFGLYDMN